ncbi:MAG: histidine kinase [Reichenbachiella sp.]|uniref:sensor histidine kinase n=1 Tax=Reichenbachiella sp. TaxID=2184521 RepID=UPI003265F640
MSKLFVTKRPPIGQLLIYATALIFSLIVVVQSSKMDDGNISLNLNHIILFTINYLIWALLVPYLYGALVDVFDHSPRPSGILFFVFRIVALIFLHFVLSNLLYYATLILISGYSWHNFVADMQMVYLRAMLSRAVDVAVIVGLLKVIENFQSLSASKLQLSELEKQLSQSELTALKAQLNPHFLFNSLHALHSLIGYDDEKAKSMTIKISNLLRKNLDQSGKHLITLEEELAYLKDYMDIELERFHDRLTIQIDSDNQAKQELVPNMLLQPLVENAFKHGISLIEGNSKITLSAANMEDGLEIIITNTVPAQNQDKSSAPSMGIGLNNVKHRMKQVYADQFKFDVCQTSKEFSVRLLIPKKSTL